ncbi:hypothetical protein HPB48_018831 [Haemaphysalis longicornis]|uniref:Serine carboxypeptidase n=1 Tax=Haemaphysalis longicornis TaxID=44386 RepID=A0A9J6G0B1_HAELO|nr:hypothetical protein HPB48_018831 [Haemaphysalis longicornis]
MHYTGQLDIVVAYPFTEALMHDLRWSGSEEFLNATQQVWRSLDGKRVQGYARCARNFTMLLLRNAGHIAPHDMPQSSYDAITRFLDDIPFVD